MSNSASERIGFTKRKDGLGISTIRPLCMAWYGKYETAIIRNGEIIKIAEGYETLEEAKAGHEKYVNMPTEEIDKIKWIG